MYYEKWEVSYDEHLFCTVSLSLSANRLINRFEHFLCQNRKRLHGGTTYLGREVRCSAAQLPHNNMKYVGVGVLIQISLSSVRPEQTSDLTKFVPLDVNIGDGAQSSKLQVLLSVAVPYDADADRI